MKLAPLLALCLLISACSQLKMAGGCEYERVISTRYVCPAEGTVEHNRLAPWNPEL